MRYVTWTVRLVVFLFRPPYGARDANVDGIARAHGMLQILWNVDSRDSLGADYAQIEGNVIQGVSRTLMEEVQFDASGVKNLDWASYPIITFQDAPEVEVVLVVGCPGGGRESVPRTIGVNRPHRVPGGPSAARPGRRSRAVRPDWRERSGQSPGSRNVW